jgi:hypothetical protein
VKRGPDPPCNTSPGARARAERTSLSPCLHTNGSRWGCFSWCVPPTATSCRLRGSTRPHYTRAGCEVRTVGAIRQLMQTHDGTARWRWRCHHRMVRCSTSRWAPTPPAPDSSPPLPRRTPPPRHEPPCRPVLPVRRPRPPRPLDDPGRRDRARMDRTQMITDDPQQHGRTHPTKASTPAASCRI